MTQREKIYLDYAAATPVDPRVLRAMQPYFSKKFGNAGSLHSFGQEAIRALDAARETIAHCIGADFQEIIFTGSATEANNLILRGVMSRLPKPRIIISSIEHESVLGTARSLKNDGADVICLPVDKTGLVDLKKLRASLNKNTILVSIMYANNEIGTVQPIVEVTKIVASFKNLRSSPSVLHPPFFHTDASQAFQFLRCDIRSLGVDFMTLSSHKIYGPKGAGALYVKQGANISPMLTGGNQEFGVR
jgi:cysteine desulfurase